MRLLPGLGLVAGVAGVAGVGLLVWAGMLWRGPGPLSAGPQDRPPAVAPAVAPAVPGPLRITLFGTSLSSPRYDWPETLAQTLSGCLEREVALTRVTQPGGDLDWAAGQVAAVLAGDPDIVLVEFAINDADLRDGIGGARAEAALGALVADLRGAGREAAPALVLLTMSPAHGARGVMRPRLAAHYAGVRRVAEAVGTGLVDLEARWRALPRSARGLEADGLHPAPEVARSVIVPVLAEYLCQGLRA